MVWGSCPSFLGRLIALSGLMKSPGLNWLTALVSWRAGRLKLNQSCTGRRQRRSCVLLWRLIGEASSRHGTRPNSRAHGRLCAGARLGSTFYRKA